MASGTFSLGQSGNMIGQIVWSSVADSTNNRSTITASLQIKKSSNTTQATTGTWNGNLTIGSVGVTGRVSENYSFYASIGTTYVTVKTLSTTISHNNDGKLTVNISGSANGPTGTSLSGYSVSNWNACVMDDIARSSAPTLSNANPVIGSSITIYTNRKSSSFTHTLRYHWGITDATIATGVASSYTWTLPMSLCNALPNSTTGWGNIYCDTYNGSQFIGTKQVRFDANVPANVVPTISSVSISEGTEGIASKFNAYVQNKSTLNVAITAAGSYSSTIKSYETYIQAVPYRTASFTSDIITASGTIGVRTIVTDSRGRTATVTNNVTILAYSSPKISSMNAWRITSGEVASEDGTRIAMKMKFAISSVNNRNNHTYAFKYKKSTDTDFTTFGSGTASWSYDDTQYFTSSPTISTDYSYIVRLEISDFFETTVMEAQIPTGFTIMDFNKNGQGMAIGRVSQNSSFEFGMESDFYKCVNFHNSNGVIHVPVIFYRSDGTELAYIQAGDYSTNTENDLLVNFKDSNGSWKSNIILAQDGTIYCNDLKIGTGGGIGSVRKSLLDSTYPVGSIYMSVVNTSPASLFGGTWEQLKDRFLLGAGDSYTAGNTGGESTHTLTVNEIPSHRHSVKYSASSTSTGWRLTTQSGQYVEDGAYMGYTGGGAAHNNMPPYLVVYMWKRTA